MPLPTPIRIAASAAIAAAISTLALAPARASCPEPTPSECADPGYRTTDCFAEKVLEHLTDADWVCWPAIADEIDAFRSTAELGISTLLPEQTVDPDGVVTENGLIGAASVDRHSMLGGHFESPRFSGGPPATPMLRDEVVFAFNGERIATCEEFGHESFNDVATVFDRSLSHGRSPRAIFDETFTGTAAIVSDLGGGSWAWTAADSASRPISAPTFGCRPKNELERWDPATRSSKNNVVCAPDGFDRQWSEADTAVQHGWSDDELEVLAAKLRELGASVGRWDELELQKAELVMAELQGEYGGSLGWNHVKSRIGPIRLDCFMARAGINIRNDLMARRRLRGSTNGFPRGEGFPDDYQSEDWPNGLPEVPLARGSGDLGHRLLPDECDEELANISVADLAGNLFREKMVRLEAAQVFVGEQVQALYDELAAVCPAGNGATKCDWAPSRLSTVLIREFEPRITAARGQCLAMTNGGLTNLGRLFQTYPLPAQQVQAFLATDYTASLLAFEQLAPDLEAYRALISAAIAAAQEEIVAELRETLPIDPETDRAVMDHTNNMEGSSGNESARVSFRRFSLNKSEYGDELCHASPRVAAVEDVEARVFDAPLPAAASADVEIEGDYWTQARIEAISESFNQQRLGVRAAAVYVTAEVWREDVFRLSDYTPLLSAQFWVGPVPLIIWGDVVVYAAGRLEASTGTGVSANPCLANGSVYAEGKLSLATGLEILFGLGVGTAIVPLASSVGVRGAVSAELESVFDFSVESRKADPNEAVPEWQQAYNCPNDPMCIDAELVNQRQETDLYVEARLGGGRVSLYAFVNGPGPLDINAELVLFNWAAPRVRFQPFREEILDVTLDQELLCNPYLFDSQCLD